MLLVSTVARALILFIVVVRSLFEKVTGMVVVEASKGSPNKFKDFCILSNILCNALFYCKKQLFLV